MGPAGRKWTLFLIDYRMIPVRCCRDKRSFLILVCHLYNDLHAIFIDCSVAQH